MYGFVNSALEKLICRRFGREKWEEVKQTANIYLGETSTFHVNTVYKDDATYVLVGAASEVLGLDPASILEMFGEQFLVWCKESGYAAVLQLLGRSLQDFLTNLDALHDHLSIIYPKMDAPSFRCTGEGSEFNLHYYSSRDGLESIVKGIVKAVAREFYNVEVSMVLIKAKGNDEDHSCFRIKEIAYYADRNTTNSVTSTNSASNKQLVSSESFCKCFPFHIIFNRNMKMLQVGASLACVIHGWNLHDKTLNSFFSLERPRMKLNFTNILAHINTIFILKLLSHSQVNLAVASNVMRLRGQMVYLPESESVLFLCSPRVSSIGELDQLALYLSDIPLHDATRGLLMMSQTAQTEFHHVVELEEVIGQLNVAQQSLEDEKGRMRDLLHQMLPISVADSLMAGQMIEAERFESVTILFSDIVGFTSICSKCEPIQIVSMLNKLYTLFDEVVGINGVYKVETIGDAYMVVGGLPEKNDIHAECVANQALDMMFYCQQVIRPDTNESILMRIGIHSGEVVAGIVGRRMPRYCLFGNTVNVASRTESNGEQGKIQITEATYKLLCDNPSFKFMVRGPMQFKNCPEPIMCYFLLENTSKGEYLSLDVPEEITYDFMQTKDTPPATPFVYASSLSNRDSAQFNLTPIASPQKHELQFSFKVTGPTPGHTPLQSPPMNHKLQYNSIISNSIGCPFSNEYRKTSIESNTSQYTDMSESESSISQASDMMDFHSTYVGTISSRSAPLLRLNRSPDMNRADTARNDFAQSVIRNLSFDTSLSTMGTLLEDSQEDLLDDNRDFPRVISEPHLGYNTLPKMKGRRNSGLSFQNRVGSLSPEEVAGEDDLTDSANSSSVRYVRPRSSSIRDRVNYFESVDRSRRSGVSMAANNYLNSVHSDDSS